MIYGVGTDVCDIRRIRASLERHGERFAAKVLSARSFRPGASRPNLDRGWGSDRICHRPPVQASRSGRADCAGILRPAQKT